ncbi:MAG: J domain-containing protein [Gammaproteobacteria bacterium]|nr:J domain-containing protein [Gammaproteobacteria bacterium]
MQMQFFETTGLQAIEQPMNVKLSKGQKKFNTLLKKINEKRKQLEEWQATIPKYQQQYQAEVAPLLVKYNAHRAEIVKVLDRAYDEYPLTKPQKKKLATEIQEMAAALIDREDMDELKEIYNKYSQSDYDTEVEEDEAYMKAMMEAFYGIGADEDVDLNSAEDVFAKLHEKISAGMDDSDFNYGGQPRKKTAKILAREAKQKEEAEHAKQSIREIFRKLAKVLHPDREQDPIERNRKNELMQRVNIAYKKKDLLSLLELQLEVEQIDQSSINSIAEDRLKHYNHVLEEQLAELDQEITVLCSGFSVRGRLHNPAHFSPQFAITSILQARNELKHRIVQIKADLADFKDVKYVKAWLNEMH